MKILVINYRFLFSGGPERYMFNVIKEFEDRGLDVVTFSVRNPKNEYSPYSGYFPKNIGNSEEYLFEKYKKNIHFYYDYLTREFYSFYIRRKLRKLIKDTQPDICYLLPHKGGLSPSLIDELKKNQIPIIHRISDYNIICPQSGLYRNRRFCNDCKNSPRQVLKNKCIKGSTAMSLLRYSSLSLHRRLKLYDKIDHFVATNDFARTQFIDFGFHPDKISTIETFSNASAISQEKKISYPIQLLYIGNIDDSKGIYDLLESIKNLIIEEDRFHLNIYGGLREDEVLSVKHLIKQNNIENFVTLHSAIPPEKTQEIYVNSDVTIIPTRWVENLPNVLIESLSVGTPVVAPDHGSFASVLNEEIAFLFKPYDVQDLTDTLKQIINSPDTIELKIEKSISYAQKRFDKSKHMDSLLDLFSKFVK